MCEAPRPHVDPLTEVVIVPPIHLAGGQLPAMLDLLFRAAVLTRFDTVFVGNAMYHWDFGDGNSTMGKSSTHRYTVAGNYTIRCTVSNQLQEVSHTLAVSVYEGKMRLVTRYDTV